MATMRSGTDGGWWVRVTDEDGNVTLYCIRHQARAELVYNRERREAKRTGAFVEMGRNEEDS